MRIVITGSAGYIGSVAAERLALEGHATTLVDAGYYADIPFERRRHIEDLSAEALKGNDVVVHLAALSNDPLGELDPRLTVSVNYHATVALAAAAKAAGASKFVFASSASVYGESPMACTEASARKPIGSYSRSKFLAEQALLRMAASTFQVIILRIATVYGVSPMMRLDLVVNRMVVMAVTRGEIVVHGRGDAWRPLIHVNDVASVLVAACESSPPPNSVAVVNVGATGQNFRVLDIARTVQKAVTSAVIRTTEFPPMDPRNYRLDSTRLTKWYPTAIPLLSLSDGVAEVAAWARGVRLGPTELDRDPYVRVKRIRRLLLSGAVDRSLRWRPPSTPVASE